jgi:DTW domain-containing protein YfiP
MYLFLGNDTVVPEKSVIAVLDLDNTTVAKSTREFLARAQREQKVVTVAEDLPKSFCITDDEAGERVWLLSANPATIKKRVGGL